MLLSLWNLNVLVYYHQLHSNHHQLMILKSQVCITLVVVYSDFSCYVTKNAYTCRFALIQIPQLSRNKCKYNLVTLEIPQSHALVYGCPADSLHCTKVMVMTYWFRTIKQYRLLTQILKVGATNIMIYGYFSHLSPAKIK